MAKIELNTEVGTKATIEKEEQLSLNTLTDQQKVLLSSIAYLDISDEGLVKMKNGGIKLSDLEPYLSQADVKSSGDFPVGSPETDKDLWKNLCNYGFGDLVITDMTSNGSTGFQAMTFKDEVGNTGITYRGSDFDFAQGGLKDWGAGNALEHFTGQSEHADEAIKYFEQQHDKNGSNYIYGYSLGGNQVQHTFAEHHDSIQEAFSFNGNSISPSKLDTQEKIAAFNSDKFNCCIIEGDIIGMSKQNELYKNNVTCIKNQNGITTNFMNAHGQAAATYDKDGNFVTIPYEEMIQNVKEVYKDADFGIQFQLLGKEFNIDFGIDNMWELVGVVQQAGVKSSEFCESVRDGIDKLPTPIKDAVTTLADGLDLPVIGIITNPQESIKQYQEFIANTSEKARKYLPSVEDLQKYKIFDIPLNMLKGGAELFNDAAGGIYKQVTDGQKTIINLTKNAIFAPDELAKDINQGLQSMKKNYSSWMQNTMEKIGLSPMLENSKVVETVEDLKEWGSQLQSKFPSITEAPQWLQEVAEKGIENSWLANAFTNNKEISIDSICDGFKGTVEKVKNIDIKEIGQDTVDFVKDKAQDFGNAMKTGYEKAKDGLEYVGDKLEDGYHYVGDKLEQAGDAVGDWIEEDLGIDLPWR